MTTDRRHATARAEPPDAAQFTRRGDAWSEVSALNDGTYRVRLGGPLPAAWMVGVCNGLARQDISIDRAHARRLAHDGTWIAELHVHALPTAADPLELPVISFAEEASLASADPLTLHDYELSDTHDHGGSLRLTFTAPDSLGLLGSLLLALANLSLLPVEMHIETSGREAQDCLWLASSGHAHPETPSEADRRALDRVLRHALQH